jgi:DNA primase
MTTHDQHTDVRTPPGPAAHAIQPTAAPGTPVSFPLTWTDLDQITLADFTVHTAIGALAGSDPWADES